MEVIGCATVDDRATSPGRRSGSLGCRGTDGRFAGYG
jgi:hypothetical protein